jgi:predicted ABC-type exoprotein transport system permease subunit
MDNLRYWTWLVRGSGQRRGVRTIVNWWLLLHIAFGIILASIVSGQLKLISNAVLLPMVGVLVGLSFAWSGNAQSLLQSDEIHLLSQHHPGGLLHYVYTFQTAILTILVTTVLWALAGLGVFDDTWPTQKHSGEYFLIESFLFALSSLTLRECWHVVAATNSLLILRADIKEKLDRGQNQENNCP